MRTRTRILTLGVAALLPWAGPRAAPADGAFGYSGYLLTSTGAAETAAQDLRFSLHDAATGGVEVWTQTLTVVPDAQGWFSVALGGAGHALPPERVASQLWLAIKVGSEPEMAPRTPLGAVPLALGVDWGGVLNRPAACSSGSYLRGFDPATGAALCDPAGAGGGAVSSVSGTGAISASPTTGAVQVSLGGCGAASQILQWSGTEWACTPAPAFPRSRVNYLTWPSAPPPIGTNGSTASVGPAFAVTKADAASDLEVHLGMVAQVSIGLLSGPSPITFCLVVSPNVAPVDGSCTVVETAGTAAFHIYTRLQGLAAGPHSIQLTLAGASGMTVSVQSGPATSYLFANEVY